MSDSKRVLIGDGETLKVRASAERVVRFEIEVQPPDAAIPPEPPPSPPVVQVRAYSQRDPRYADDVYAGGTTFRSAGCLVVCVAMIASLVYEGEPLTYPPEVARRLRAAGAFSGALLSHPARISDALPKLQWGGAIHWRQAPARLEVLADEVERYGATICEVKFDPRKPLVWTDDAGRTHWNQHFIIIEAVDVDGDDAVAVDPWTGTRQLLTSCPCAKPMGWGASRALYGMRLVRAGDGG